jgi:hypothetical protein
VPAEQQPPGRVGDDQRLNGVGAGLAADEPMATGPTRGRAAHPDLSSIEQAHLPAGAQVGDHVGQGAAGCRPRRCSHARPNSGRTSPIAWVILERDTPNQQTSTSGVTPWRRCTRVASSRSRNTSRCRAPAPTARRRGRSASRASWRACQRGPSSATSSASTSRDSPVTRRSATAAGRASVLDTQPCSVRHEQTVDHPGQPAQDRPCLYGSHAEVKVERFLAGVTLDYRSAGPRPRSASRLRRRDSARARVGPMLPIGIAQRVATSL